MDMVLDLSKGDNFSLDLTKEVDYDIALRWDYDPSMTIDLDVSAFMLNQVGDKRKLTAIQNVVYFKEGFNVSKCGSVSLSGDSLDGSGDGDDEVITVKTKLIPSDIVQINIYVNIYSPKVSFNKVKNAQAFVRTSTGSTLAQFNMSVDFDNENSILVGSLLRTTNGWDFQAGGYGYVINDLNTIVQSLHTEGV